MSLLRFAIRATTIAALRDKTWAQSNVFDSDLTPFGSAVLGKGSQPYIVVYTDADDIDPVVGKEIYDGDNRSLSIVLEIGVASSVHDPSPTGPIVIKFNQTDAGMESACDVVEAQCLSALIGGASVNDPWADVWKRFCYDVRKITRRRGGESSTGVRYTARRVIISVCTNYDFAPGMAVHPDHPINTFMELAADDVEHPTVKMVDYGVLMAKLIPVTAAPDWRFAQSLLGLDTEGIKMVVPTGTPLPWPHVEEPPLDTTDANEFPPQLDWLTMEENGELIDVDNTPVDPNPLRPRPLEPEILP